MRVDAAEAATPELVKAFERLVPQLSRSSPPPTAEELQALINQPGTHVLIAADDDGTVIGTLTLVLFRIPTGTRAWIEDVVVDEAGRGRGVGEALTRRALDIAREHDAKTVDLTSRPSRQAANRLYQRIGFEQRDTNVYRCTLEP
jgi:ribosomal protein S18 acetylase RimI-like enzyme